MLVAVEGLDDQAANDHTGAGITEILTRLRKCQAFVNQFTWLNLLEALVASCYIRTTSGLELLAILQTHGPKPRTPDPQTPDPPPPSPPLSYMQPRFTQVFWSDSIL